MRKKKRWMGLLFACGLLGLLAAGCGEAPKAGQSSPQNQSQEEAAGTEGETASKGAGEQAAGTEGETAKSAEEQAAKAAEKAASEQQAQKVSAAEAHVNEYLDKLASEQPDCEMVLYRTGWEDEGLRLSDTMALLVDGDQIERVVEVVLIDFSVFAQKVEQDIKTQMLSLLDELTKQFQSVQGVSCTQETEETFCTMYIDVSKEAMQELAEDEKLVLKEGTSGFSLKETEQALKEKEYQKVEQ